MAQELWIAREKLSSQGLRNKSFEVKDWSDYCEEIGSSRQGMILVTERANTARDKKAELSGVTSPPTLADLGLSKKEASEGVKR